MVLLAAFDKDPASINIRDRLLESGEGEIVGEVEGYPRYTFSGFDLITLKGEHLYRNDLDSIFERCNPGGYKLLIVLSRHSSKTKIPTLTVHPTGNYGRALYGGVDYTLSTSAPQPMRNLLLAMKKAAEERGLVHRVSYEVTHHGPLITTPHLFIEIGSDAERWVERDAAEVLATTLLEVFNSGYKESEEVKVAVGVGGGHYAPRFTDIALKGDVAFGHILPEYAIEEALRRPETVREMVRKTPGAERCYAHTTKRSREAVERVCSLLNEMGLEVY